MLSILDKNTLKAGKTNPFIIDIKIPKAKRSLESLAYEKSRVKIES
jgi:hypothetical protein